MWWDNIGFSLKLHGDRYEREWWPLISSEFPSYEAFWIKHVVPLTSRIDFRVAQGEPRWIMMRPNVNRILEQMAMAHYSVFYYLARTTVLLTSKEKLWFEDAFNLLRVSGYNLHLFLEQCKKLFVPLGVNGAWLPLKFTSGQAAWKVKVYRDALLKNPVIGRAENIGREFLPGEAVIDKVRNSWLRTQALAKQDFVVGRDLIAGYRKKYAGDLDDIWRRLLHVLEPVRSRAGYLAMMGLTPSGRVDGDSGGVPQLVSLVVSAASGSQILPS